MHYFFNLSKMPPTYLQITRMDCKDEPIYLHVYMIYSLIFIHSSVSNKKMASVPAYKGDRKTDISWWQATKYAPLDYWKDVKNTNERGSGEIGGVPPRYVRFDSPLKSWHISKMAPVLFCLRYIIGDSGVATLHPTYFFRKFNNTSKKIFSADYLYVGPEHFCNLW